MFNSGSDLFLQLGPKEYYKTIGFKELAFIYGNTKESYRETIDLINHVRYQEQNGTPYRTLQNNTKKEGEEIINYMIEKSNHILHNNGFTNEGEFQGQGDNSLYADSNPITISNEEIIKSAEAEALQCNYNVDEMLNNPVPYEDPKNTVRISIDDVVVKKQNEKREKFKSEEESKKKKLHDTIAHIQMEKKWYALAGYSTKQVLCFILAFIFHNKLIGNRLQFFTDGHKVLNDTIFKRFSWYKNIGIILDWYHLVKKCKEQLSMAMKGRVIRNQVLVQIMPFLWHGLTNKAIKSLADIPTKDVKNQKILDKLISYLERHKEQIPCYAIRKRLGLCNSSAIGEKTNDLIVSKRQKHNGMSWSKDGSIALASITTLKRNNEYKKWFEEKELEYKLAA